MAEKRQLQATEDAETGPERAIPDNGGEAHTKAEKKRLKATASKGKGKKKKKKKDKKKKA